MGKVTAQLKMNAAQAKAKSDENEHAHLSISYFGSVFMGCVEKLTLKV